LCRIKIYSCSDSWVVWKTPQRQLTDKNQTPVVTLVMEQHEPQLPFYIGVGVLDTTS